MRLAIAAQDPRAYTETFIRMQYERLPCALRIHGGPIASETHPGGAIAPLKSLRGLAETAYDVGIRRTRWEGPQSRELVRRLKQTGIDTMLVNFGPYAAALLPICVALGIRMVPHFHGFDAHLASAVEKHRDAYRCLGRQAHRVIAVSDHMTRALVDLGIPAERIRLVRYGVDTAAFREKTVFPANPVFFAVGRFVDKKAPYLTLLAFQKAHARFPSARLALAGDGPLLEATRNLCQALGLDAAVDFPGPLPHASVADRMAEATAFVQHSITPEHGESRGDSEGTPVAMLEAMVCGLPIIATRHAGIGEVVEHGVTGLLVAERDVNGMANAMAACCDNPDLPRRLGAAARVAALSRYTADHYISGLQAALA